MYTFSCINFSTTRTGKGHDYQIRFPGIIHYNFVPSTKFEVKYREYLVHIIVKVRGEF